MSHSNAGCTGYRLTSSRLKKLWIEFCHIKTLQAMVCTLAERIERFAWPWLFLVVASPSFAQDSSRFPEVKEPSHLNRPTFGFDNLVAEDIRVKIAENVPVNNYLKLVLSLSGSPLPQPGGRGENSRASDVRHFRERMSTVDQALAADFLRELIKHANNEESVIRHMRLMKQVTGNNQLQVIVTPYFADNSQPPATIDEWLKALAEEAAALRREKMTNQCVIIGDPKDPGSWEQLAKISRLRKQIVAISIHKLGSGHDLSRVDEVCVIIHDNLSTDGQLKSGDTPTALAEKLKAAKLGKNTHVELLSCSAGLLEDFNGQRDTFAHQLAAALDRPVIAYTHSVRLGIVEDAFSLFPANSAVVTIEGYVRVYAGDTREIVPDQPPPAFVKKPVAVNRVIFYPDGSWLKVGGTPHLVQLFSAR